ncbi:hypothetical protein GCM10017744_102420 [Streptomyces antimycoticus]|uniref:Uncharacterized protein n=1 Tax=Streptomyces antimycoticus TaxID=68175 RepID=A0A4D4KJZ6_9ACTN|nr:hypothetical protein [Streptomyces antimycoticus]GDY49275.1 hypothetical protein SANT12839_101570 [Streptomyces antimycoticus]
MDTVVASIAAFASSIIAVAGTLLGARLQQHGTAEAEQAARNEQIRKDRHAAYQTLLSRMRKHRRNLYTRWELRDADAAQQDKARWQSWESSSDVVDALDDVELLTDDPELLRLASAAVGATFALKKKGERGVTQAEMDTRGERAREAQEEFRAAARQLLLAAI